VTTRKVASAIVVAAKVRSRLLPNLLKL